MYTYSIGDRLQVTLLEERMSFKNFVVTLLSGDWPELNKLINLCETGYQSAKINFCPFEKRAYITVYTD